MGSLLRNRFVRFLFSGGLNTLFTYALYLLLIMVLPYQVSYAIAYAVGIALAFILNRTYVFESHRGTLSLLLFPLVYVAQYVLGAGMMWGLVDGLHLSPLLAPLLVVVMTIPVTFVLSRFVFLKKK
ncbi:GtrA family protein [Pseudomonas subflava]|uniref:GtrA family protein n=1 Tax=Pseudomonas subflava TaxID=2952933 RepID=UPI00207AD54D|nr:GtrA family protein [Pseudomonas subflava]